MKRDLAISYKKIAGSLSGAILLMALMGLSPVQAVVLKTEETPNKNISSEETINIKDKYSLWWTKCCHQAHTGRYRGAWFCTTDTTACDINAR